MQTLSTAAAYTLQFINQTNRSVFLTGKAGTGKTTLLKEIIKTTHKNTVVVAPTGIAALNANGVTIHSMFQLPFSLGNAMTYHKAQGSGLLYLHLDFEFLNYGSISNEAKWQTLYVGLSRVIDPSKVYIHEKSIKILERQYRLFQQINYNKLNLIFDSVEMQPQHYITRS